MIDKFMIQLMNLKTSSPHTERAYRFELEALFRHVLQTPTSAPPQFDTDFSPEQGDRVLLNWALGHLRSTGGTLKAASKNRRAAVIKSFFTHLYETRQTTQNLSLLIPTPKVPRLLPSFLGVDEAIAVLKALECESRKSQATDPQGNSSTAVSVSHSHYLLFLLLYTCGLRVSEACDLTWSRVEFSVGQLRVRGKGQKERLVPLLALTNAGLEEQRRLQTSAYGPRESIWGESKLHTRVAYDWIRRSGVIAGLHKRLHPHALRHSYATHLLQGGMNLRYLQTLLGHESLTATEKYTHLSLEDLRKQLSERHPLKKMDVG